MTGKIFQESNNVFQDQAKILFNYYSQAAEKIVQEEERIESEIASLETQKDQLETAKQGLWKWFLTIILFFMYFIKKNQLNKAIDELDEDIADKRKQHENIFRDYKVTKLGVAYVPVADQIKYNDKSFIVDYTGKVDESEITLQTPRQNNLLVETISKVEDLAKNAPLVESSKHAEAIETNEYSPSISEISEYDYLGKLDHSLRTLSRCMQDLDTSSVSLPLVADKSEYLSFLNEYATTSIPKDAPTIKVFDKEKYTGSVNKFKELNKLKDSLSNQTQQFEDVLKGLMVTIANSVDTISTLKVSSADKVILESNKVLYQILKAPYNHYHPELEHDEIERIRNEKFDYSEDIQGYEPFQLKQSSRVRYNLLTGEWCAEDGSTTNTPFGVHQIYEEIVAPIVQNLMEENRIERLKIYNHIKDQKISYLNKWHQDTDAFYRANRAESSDLINLMQESLREFVASYNTLISLKRTEDNMSQSNASLDSTIVDVVDNTSESLALFESQAQEFRQTQQEFEQRIEEIKEDIDLRTEAFGHVEYYDAKLRDGHSNEVAVAASEVHELDERRKPLASVNPLFAKISELLPTPSINNVTYEHMALDLSATTKEALGSLNFPLNMKSSKINDEAEVIEQDVVETAEEIETDAVEESTENEPIEQSANELPESPTETEEPETIDVAEETEAEEIDDVEETEENNGSDDDEGENDDEDYLFSEEELSELEDEDLMEILDELEITYDKENFNREQAISFILESQE